MDLDEARAVIAAQHRAVLSTVRQDGTPQLSPVLVGLDGDGHLVISSRQPAFKVRNIRRDPQVSLCVLPDGFFGRWIQVDGTAEVLGLPHAMEPLVEYYRSVSGEHPDWAQYRSQMTTDQRVLLRITPTRAGPDRAG